MTNWTEHFACCSLLMLIHESESVTVPLSSSGPAQLQWVCGDTWNRGWNLQAVRSVVQHTETQVDSCVCLCNSCNLYLWKHSVLHEVCVLCWCMSRGEFENDATPDLNKDVYLQDIHCVSSLCKAYFRELPNPLLTYQLYDKFAVSSSDTQTFHTT